MTKKEFLIQYVLAARKAGSAPIIPETIKFAVQVWDAIERETRS